MISFKAVSCTACRHALAMTALRHPEKSIVLLSAPHSVRLDSLSRCRLPTISLDCHSASRDMIAVIMLHMGASASLFSSTRPGVPRSRRSSTLFNSRKTYTNVGAVRAVHLQRARCTWLKRRFSDSEHALPSVDPAGNLGRAILRTPIFLIVRERALRLTAAAHLLDAYLGKLPVR